MASVQQLLDFLQTQPILVITPASLFLTSLSVLFLIHPQLAISVLLQDVPFGWSSLIAEWGCSGIGPHSSPAHVSLPSVKTIEVYLPSREKYLPSTEPAREATGTTTKTHTPIPGDPTSYTPQPKPLITQTHGYTFCFHGSH